MSPIKLTIIALLVPGVCLAGDDRIIEKAIEEYQQHFRSLDINRSGRIERDEIEVSAEQRHRALDLNSDGYLDLEEYRKSIPGIETSVAKNRIKKIDKNGDGKVSLDETKIVARQLMRLDTNRDGVLSFDELMITAPPAVKRYYKALNERIPLPTTGQK